MSQHNNHDIDKAFVSPYDVFLAQFDATHKLSLSQKKEIAKHLRIAALRDNPTPSDSESIIWDEF